jgi:hypothetical protein
MAWAEDVITEYFGNDDFAEDWTVNGVPIRAIFDDAYVEDFGIEGTSPQIQVPTVTADAIPVAAGQTAIGPNGTYTVRGIQPSGDGNLGKGVSLLILEET